MEEVKAKLRDLCKNSGDFKQVELELERAGLNVESSLDGDYSTPLMIASFGNNWKLAIHFHVRMRAKLNTFDDFFGFTALHFCSLKSSVECAAALKLMGCDATLREKRGRDYLQLGEGGANFKQAVEALESNFRKCCDAITQHRAADLEVALACSHSLTHLVDENGNTLLIKAVAQLRFELAELLAKRGSDWFWANKEDQSALSILAGKLSMKSATFMRNTLRDVKDENANTLLHHLAMRRDARPSHLAVMIQLGLAEEAARNAENHTFVEVADNRGAQNFEREIEQAKRALRCEDWQNIESVMQRMIEAEQQSEPAEFLEILTKNSALAFFLRENGETWLHSQFVAKYSVLIEALLSFNSELLSQTNAKALTPIQKASECSNLQAIQNFAHLSDNSNAVFSSDLRLKLINYFQNEGDFSKIDNVFEEFEIDSDAALNGNNWSALFFAAFANNWKAAIHLILHKSANMNSVDTLLRTPLMVSAEWRKPEVAVAFKLLGCDTTLQSEDRRDYLQLGDENFLQNIRAIENNFEKARKAIQENNENALKEALGNWQFLVDLVDQDGDSLLIMSVRSNHLELAKILAKLGADWFFSNKNQQSAFDILMGNLTTESLAFIRDNFPQYIKLDDNECIRKLALCLKAKPKAIALLVEVGLIQLDVPNKEKDNFLDFAAQLGATNLRQEIEFAKISLKCENWENIENMMQQLEYLEEQNDAVKFLEILTNNTILSLLRRPNGETWLHSQFVAKNYQLVEALMNQNADLINQLNAEALTPLQSAVKSSNIDAARNLLLMSADPDLRSKNSKSALCTAISKSNFEMIRLLVEFKADLNAIISPIGDTALHKALTMQRADIMMSLHILGANFAIKNKNGESIEEFAAAMDMSHVLDELEQLKEKSERLLCAAKQANLEELKNLLSDDSLYKWTHQIGLDLLHQTILSDASLESKKESLAWLIENGADLNLKNAEGETAAHICAKLNEAELASLLLYANADFSLTNAANKTPLQTAKCFDSSNFQKNTINSQIQIMNTKMDEIRQKTNKRIQIMQTTFEEKLQNCRDQNLELQKTMQEKMNVMQSCYEKKLQDCINDFEMKQSVANLQANQTNKKMTRLNERVAQLETDQLEMARLVVEEPSQRAIQILKASLRKYPINADVSISPSNSCEDKELYEATKFMREIRQYEAELAKLKETRHRNREKLKNQLRSAMSATIIMDDDLIESIDKSEKKLSEIAPELQQLKNSISSNTQRILASVKMEDALCDRHSIVKSFVSKSCDHRVCELCVEEENVCGRCGVSIESYIKEVERH